MLLRVWDDLMAEPNAHVLGHYTVPALIIASGLKVTTHNVLSLGTKTNAYIMYNPPLNEEHPLKNWYATNSADVTALMHSRAYRDTDRLFRPPSQLEIIPLGDAIATIGEVKTLWTRGKLTYLPGQEKLWFEACEKCYRPVYAYVDWNIWCSNCQERTKIIVRGSVNVYLRQDGVFVESSIKSPDTEKLLPFTPNELRVAAYLKTPLSNEVEAALENKNVICFIKYYDRTTRGNMVRRYPILKVYTEEEFEAFHADGNNGNDQPPQEQPPIAALLHKKPAQKSLPTTPHAAVPTNAPPEHIGSSSSAPASQTDSEFFTPTTNTVLEEIANEPTAEETHGQSPPKTKRMLPFDSPESEDESTIPAVQSPEFSTIEDDTAASAQPSTDDAKLSPSKKFKGKKKTA